MGPVTPKSTGPVRIGKDRIEAWKAIAAHLDRDVRTVQRWERESGMPVHRLPGGPKAGVFAFRSELDAWRESTRTEMAAAGPAPPRRRHWLRWLGVAGGVLVLAIGALGIIIGRAPQPMLTAGLRFTPFATTLELQACPAWSPDGKSIAFVGRVAGHAGIMTQAVNGARPFAVSERDVTILGGADRWCRRPIWAPDSQSIYFLGSQDGAGGLYRVPAAGGRATLMQRGAAAASISPDGQTAVFLAAASGKIRVWVASPPENPRRLYHPSPFESAGFRDIPQAAFSPDGTQILVGITTEAGYETWRLPWPEGKAERVFTKAERAVGSPSFAWMPDSRHLIFSGYGVLAAGDLRTGRYWPVAFRDRASHAPSPSPDGTRIAYQAMLSHVDVIAVPLGEGSAETVAGSSLSEQMPAASPVSAQIAYVNARNPAGIWLRSLDGAWERPLVAPGDVKVEGESAKLLMTPVFSADGSRLAFTAVAPGGSGIFTIAASGGVPVRAGGSPLPNSNSPTWSPDGRWLAFRRYLPNGPRLMKLHLSGAGEIVDLAPMCGKTMPEWSPSGEWIAFADEQCRTGIVRPDGADRRNVGGPGTIAWSRDGSTLYRFDETAKTLVAYDVAAGRERVVRQVGDLLPYSVPQPGLRASITADGSRIVYSVLRPREEIWILEGVDIREPWYARLLSLIPSKRR